MPSQVNVGIIGDYRPTHETHRATNEAIQHAADALGLRSHVQWLPTESIENSPEELLSNFDALWCAPGSPYRSEAGAHAAIRFARENDVPFLGTCGGFQHAVLEYARNVLGFEAAQHGESDPGASVLFLSQLECSLAGKQMEVTLAPGSIAHAAYGCDRSIENYYCNFAINPDHRAELERSAPRISGQDQDGEIRVIEIPENRFFLATLFVPQMRSKPGSPHPLVRGFVKAAATKLAQKGARTNFEVGW